MPRGAWSFSKMFGSIPIRHEVHLFMSVYPISTAFQSLHVKRPFENAWVLQQGQKMNASRMQKRSNNVSWICSSRLFQPEGLGSPLGARTAQPRNPAAHPVTKSPSVIPRAADIGQLSLVNLNGLSDVNSCCHVVGRGIWTGEKAAWWKQSANINQFMFKKSDFPWVISLIKSPYFVSDARLRVTISVTAEFIEDRCPARGLM